jgi:disease resistance protein RPM1
VSQIYTVESLLRKLLWKIGHMEPPVPREIDKMDVHDLKEEIKRKLQNRKCLIVLDDVWEQEVYFKIHDAFQNPDAPRKPHHHYNTKGPCWCCCFI